MWELTGWGGPTWLMEAETPDHESLARPQLGAGRLSALLG